VKGSLAAPMIGQATASAARERDEQEMRAIVTVRDPAERARLQRRLNEQRIRVQQNAANASTWAGRFEHLARAGVPVQLTIRRRRGGYEMRVTQVLWQTTKEQDFGWMQLIRISPLTLLVPQPPANLAPLQLKLVRAKPHSNINQIREDGYEIQLEPGLDQTCVIRWNFVRQETQ